MSPTTETPSKLGIGSTAKALSSFKRFPALLTLPLALALCFQPISANAKQTSKTMSSLNAQQIASLLQQQGVAKEKIPTMTAIALAESSGRPQAFNPRGLDRSYGLFQVNMYGGLGPARMKQFGLKSEKDLFDPTTNVKAAKQILESQGLGAWSVYKGGQYKQFLPEAQKATAALGQSQAPQPETATRISPTPLLFGDTIPKVDPNKMLGDFILKNIATKELPEVQSAIDPLALLRSAFASAPVYLGDQQL